jgi:hypothetical protein
MRGEGQEGSGQGGITDTKFHFIVEKRLFSKNNGETGVFIKNFVS